MLVVSLPAVLILTEEILLVGFVTSKPKNDQRPMKRTSPIIGCLLTLLALALGFALGAALIIILAAPTGFDLFGINETAAALYRTQYFVDETRQANEQRALDIERTQASVANERQLLGQTATQNALDRAATQTADVISNVQQQTQIALDYVATQSALGQMSTQVALNFQATRAAINQNATAINLPNTAPITSDNLWDDWIFAGGNGFNRTASGINAVGAGWLKTRRADFSAFRFDAVVTSVDGVYTLFFLGGEWNASASFTIVDRGIAQVELSSFTQAVADNAPRLLPAPPALVALATENPRDARPLANTVTLTVMLANGRLSAGYDERIVVEASVLAPPMGALAVELPAGAVLERVQIADMP